MRWDLAGSLLRLRRRYWEDCQEHARRLLKEDRETCRREYRRLSDWGMSNGCTIAIQVFKRLCPGPTGKSLVPGFWVAELSASTGKPPIPRFFG
ncbi:hypothetical protein BHM03_00008988 [Ensete ventricosum]|nr:hypothetical protein BHM03_00008988 [Ensete ventricosum]